MFKKLKLFIHLISIPIYFSGCGFSGNESEFGSSSSSSSSSSNWLTKTSIPTKRWGGSVGAVIGTGIGAIPTGNTGGSNISPFKTMPISPEFKKIIQEAKNDK